MPTVHKPSRHVGVPADNEAMPEEINIDDLDDISGIEYIGHGAVYFCVPEKGKEPVYYKIQYTTVTGFKIKLKEWDVSVKDKICFSDWSAEIQGVVDTEQIVNKLIYLKKHKTQSAFMFKLEDRVDHDDVHFRGLAKIASLDISVTADGIIGFELHLDSDGSLFYSGKPDSDCPAAESIVECFR